MSCVQHVHSVKPLSKKFCPLTPLQARTLIKEIVWGIFTLRVNYVRSLIEVYFVIFLGDLSNVVTSVILVYSGCVTQNDTPQPLLLSLNLASGSLKDLYECAKYNVNYNVKYNVKYKVNYNVSCTRKVAKFNIISVVIIVTATAIIVKLIMSNNWNNLLLFRVRNIIKMCPPWDYSWK